MALKTDGANPIYKATIMPRYIIFICFMLLSRRLVGQADAVHLYSLLITWQITANSFN